MPDFPVIKISYSCWSPDQQAQYHLVTSSINLSFVGQETNERITPSNPEQLIRSSS